VASKAKDAGGRAALLAASDNAGRWDSSTKAGKLLLDYYYMWMPSENDIAFMHCWRLTSVCTPEMTNHTIACCCSLM